MKNKIIAFGFMLTLLVMGCGQGDLGDQVVLLPVQDDPSVSFRIFFNVGSQNDPAGKEGLAALTASIITGGSTEKHSYEEITSLLYPMAAGIGDNVDKEMTVFTGRTHTDNVEDYYALFKEVLLEPAFAQDDFDRVKSDFINYVKTTLRYSQDEELGKEVLYEFIFAGTSYGHNEDGWVQSLESITREDAQNFYKKHYTWANAVIGLGGGFEDSFAKRVKTDFETLGADKTPQLAVVTPEAISGFHVKIIEKDASATAISFGFPIDITRGNKEFYALALATSWLGEHRSSFSHLYEVIREVRGLNYGDYAYIEHFPRGHRRQFPPANVARRQQIFQIWIRPVPNETRVFAFRAALRELQALIENGMAKDDFELTRKFLKGYTLHYAPTTTMKLGYTIDDRFYGNDTYHWDNYAAMLDELTVEDVNAAVRKYLNFSNIKVVFISPDAQGLKNMLVNNAPSPIEYASEKPAEVYEEDKEISTYPLSVDPANVTIVTVEDLFEK